MARCNTCRSSNNLDSQGRVWSVRVAGPKLAFIDLFQNNRLVETGSHRQQIVLNYEKVKDSVEDGEFYDFVRSIQKGDVLSRLNRDSI